jgi:hypothetical protein
MKHYARLTVGLAGGGKQYRELDRGLGNGGLVRGRSEKGIHQFTVSFGSWAACCLCAGSSRVFARASRCSDSSLGTPREASAECTLRCTVCGGGCPKMGSPVALECTAAWCEVGVSTLLACHDTKTVIDCEYTDRIFTTGGM